MKKGEHENDTKTIIESLNSRKLNSKITLNPIIVKKDKFNK
jgi:hypothetical protein